MFSCCKSDGSVNVGGTKVQIKRKLGEGGFSVVYLAVDNSGEKYALKKIMCHDKDELRRAMKEIELHKMFNHPNLCGLINSCTLPNSNVDCDNVFILLPLFKKGTLLDVIELLSGSGSTFALEEMLTLFMGICEGLRALHDRETPLAHRDLKPGNVMLTDEGTPVLIDFGSVASARVNIHNRKEAMTLQDDAAERCSLPYRAPELIDVQSDARIDERTDIWSLGCVLYNMAFHQSPFEACVNEKGGSLNIAIQNGIVVFPQKSIYPQALNDFILFMLQVNPQKRPNIHQVVDYVQAMREEN